MEPTTEEGALEPDEITIRPAIAMDGPRYLDLVRALAEFEHLTPPDAAAAGRLLEHAFGPRPRYELRVAEVRGEVQAYAAFFETYSTFLALPSLYVEDLFVHPGARRRGIGSALMHHLAALALRRGCGRMEWAVLDWNAGAQRFYAALGARTLDEWRTCRVDGLALQSLGA